MQSKASLTKALEFLQPCCLRIWLLLKALTAHVFVDDSDRREPSGSA